MEEAEDERMEIIEAYDIFLLEKQKNKTHCSRDKILLVVLVAMVVVLN